MNEKTIQIPICDMEIHLTGDGGGSISSSLKDVCPYCGQSECYFDCDESQALETEEANEQKERYNAMVDGIESLVLAQAMSGIDIESPQYLEALETAINAIISNT